MESQKYFCSFCEFRIYLNTPSVTVPPPAQRYALMDVFKVGARIPILSLSGSMFPRASRAITANTHFQEARHKQGKNDCRGVADFCVERKS